MYGEKLIRKIGSLVVVAILITSAFAVLQNGKIAGAVMSPANTSVPIITEIMYNPTSGPEWVELYNPTDEAMNTTGWYIKDESGTLFGNLPSSIAPHTYVCVNHSEGVLNDDGDTVNLYNSTGVVVASVTYTASAPEGNSIALNETGGWVNATPTCGGVNSVINPPVTTCEISGEKIIDDMYVNVTITLSATDETTEGIRTYYKIDDGSWNEYNGSFTITAVGEHKVYFYSVDYWGATEATKNVTFEIANLTTLDVTPTTANWDDVKDVTVNNAAGNISLYDPDGVRKEGPSPPPYTVWTDVRFDKSGNWWVVDTMGNAKAIKVKPVSLDVNVTTPNMDFLKNGQSGSVIDITGTVKMNGAAATTATVKIHYPDGTTDTTTVQNDSTFKFRTVYIGLKGAGVYNISAYIGNEAAPNAFGYDTFTVNPVEPNITKVKVDAVGGFPDGKAVFEVTYPEDGNALLVANAFYPNVKYNVSVYKGNELYAWKNTSDGTSGGNITFNVENKFLNLTSTMWETGDYTLKVNVDVNGDGIWEYKGSEDYTVNAAPPVNVNILKPADGKLNVLDPSHNAQVIQIQIYGKDMNTYGNSTNMKIGPNKENLTERIKVEGDVVYAPPKDAYEEVGNGIWNITVFPAHGNGKIYVNVTWPGEETVSKEITVDDGLYASVTPASVIVDETNDINVTVKDKTKQNPIYGANVTLKYETGVYGFGDKLVAGNTQANGECLFKNVTSTKADVNIFVIVNFSAMNKYAYAIIKSQPAHDLNVAISPSQVMAGRETTFNINITRDNESYDGDFLVYVLNETQLSQLHDGKLDLSTAINVTDTLHKVSKGNYTVTDHINDIGTYYVYIKTTDSKHDNLNKEASISVSKVTVSAEPSMLVKDVDKNKTVVFTVTWNGQPVNGTLRINGIEEIHSFDVFVENESYELDIVNGTGNITGVDAIAVGNITFEFLPDTDGSEFTDADGILKVVPPEIDILQPANKVAFMAEENLIVLQVKHPLTGNGCPGMEVEIETPSSNGRIAVGTTDDNGKIMIGIMPLQTGTIKIYVNGELNGEINVYIGLKIKMDDEITKDKESVIKVTTIAGRPIEGATVKVNGNLIGETDSNGAIKYKPDETGTITVTAEKDGYYKATKTVVVVKGASSSSTPGFEFIGMAIALLAAIVIATRRRK